jgi:hypothetical protein
MLKLLLDNILKIFHIIIGLFMLLEIKYTPNSFFGASVPT